MGEQPGIGARIPSLFDGRQSATPVALSIECTEKPATITPSVKMAASLEGSVGEGCRDAFTLVARPERENRVRVKRALAGRSAIFSDLLEHRVASPVDAESSAERATAVVPARTGPCSHPTTDIPRSQVETLYTGQVTRSFWKSQRPPSRPVAFGCSTRSTETGKELVILKRRRPAACQPPIQ
jgi:hypothetical protein